MLDDVNWACVVLGGAAIFYGSFRIAIFIARSFFGLPTEAEEEAKTRRGEFDADRVRRKGDS